MEGLWVVNIIVGVVCGAISAAIASSKGRNAAGWFFGGFFIGVIGVIIVACLSNLRDDRTYRDVADTERRRLREQLRQEQLKVEALRRYSMARLDEHDKVLGVDTRNQPQLLEGPAGIPVLPATNDPAAALERMAQPRPQLPPSSEPMLAPWYYHAGGAPRGPVAAAEIIRLLQSGHIDPDTLVWCPGALQWTPANETPAFAGITRQ